ncbi:11115_t:CDS:1 [Paraglomus occultum]|uniref:11115_t:CDS:1 n=1 Tax=Paraglomus occultum TaxID=144539 RepID=A0A9N8ZBM4_9GLOM|nr:11115_t:CDS:1 [Paraglomus occultum]
MTRASYLRAPCPHDHELWEQVLESERQGYASLIILEANAKIRMQDQTTLTIHELADGIVPLFQTLRIYYTSKEHSFGLSVHQKHTDAKYVNQRNKNSLFKCVRPFQFETDHYNSADFPKERMIDKSSK